MARYYTLDEALLKMGFGKFQYLVLLYAGLSWFADAMEILLLSFIGPAIKSQWKINSQQESLMTMVVLGGMLVGAYAWGYIADKYGRRYGFLMSTLITSIAGVLSSLAPNYKSLIICRTFVGLGLGGAPVPASYFIEFVPPPRRGFWMVVLKLFWSFGTLSVAGVAWIVLPRLGWRYLLGFAALPSIIFLITYPLTLESPRFLCNKNKKEDALKVLEKISKVNGVPLPDGVFITTQELELVSDKHLSTDNENLPINDPIKRKDSNLGALQTFLVLFSPKLLRSTILIWVAFFANGIMYYSLVLLTTQLNNQNSACYRSSSPSRSHKLGINYKDVLITNMADLPGILISALIVDKLGRKTSMVILYILSGIFLLPLVKHQSESLTTIFLFGARACSMGNWTVSYVYAPEIYPTSVRTTGLGIATSISRIGGMLSPLVAIMLIQSCHQMISIVLLASVVFVAGICVPLIPYETKGVDLVDSITNIKYDKPNDFEPKISEVEDK